MGSLHESATWQLERVASGTHYAPELIRLPLDTAKDCQGTIHNMRLQNMIQLSCGPPEAWASSHIALVRKTQLLLLNREYNYLQLLYHLVQMLLKLLSIQHLLAFVQDLNLILCTFQIHQGYLE